MATKKRDETGKQIGRNINKHNVATGAKTYGLAKPKAKNPFAGVGKSIGNAISPPPKGGKKTKEQLMREYAKSKYATKKGKASVKKRVK